MAYQKSCIKTFKQTIGVCQNIEIMVDTNDFLCDYY